MRVNKQIIGKKLTAKKLGEVGELAFAMRAALLGLSVARPYGESDPYDFLIDNGKRCSRVQVRCKGPQIRPLYRVPCGRRAHNPNGKAPLTVPFKKDEVHFVAIYLLGEDLWYILPLKALGGRVHVSLRPGKTGPRDRYRRYVEKWNLFLHKEKKSPTPKILPAVIGDILACAEKQRGKQRGKQREERVVWLLPGREVAFARPQR